MKWVNSLLCILLLSNLSFGQSNLLDSVMIKFEKDRRSFEEFKVLGKLYCLDSAIGNSDIYFQTYASMYNGFSPFTRLLQKDKIEAVFDIIIKSNKIVLNVSRDSVVFYDSKSSCYYELFNSLNKVWENKNIKKYYLLLVLDENNYIQPREVNFDVDDINGFQRAYLSEYFIKPPTDGSINE